jgi:hypothetical protein
MQNKPELQNGSTDGNVGMSAGPLADYYELLAIGPGFSDLSLLRQFLVSSKRAIASGDHAALIEIRKGFEVLRYEDVRVHYYRLHRVLVRHEFLHFPEAKRREMLQAIRAKEALAINGSHPVVKPTTDYYGLLSEVVWGIVLLDLAHMLSFGAPGVVLLLGAIIIIAANGITGSIVAISIFFLALAFVILRTRARDYVTYPDQVPFGPVVKE